jgi:hypothetical protein
MIRPHFCIRKRIDYGWRAIVRLIVHDDNFLAKAGIVTQRKRKDNLFIPA